MNSIRSFLFTPVRRLAYIGTFSNIRYGCVKIVDYSGFNYIIPYTTKVYTDDIDGMINNIVCDIPPEDYHATAHIVETMINQRLTRAYGIFHDVKLLPPTKNMLPPCGSNPLA